MIISHTPKDNGGKMSISEFLVAVIWGILITLFLEILGILLWFYSITDQAPSRKTPRPKTHGPQSHQIDRPASSRQSPEILQDQPTDYCPDNETCCWLNCLTDLGFHQLRDSPELKKLMMKQINKEFMEILLTKTQGKMLERLSVREYYMGTSLPVLSNIAVVKNEKDEDSGKPAMVEVEMDVEYKGGFQLSIDADLVFNKAAYVSVQVNQIKGRGRLQFSTIPFTHWSFTFLTDPDLSLSVDSRFEGRELPQLSAFLKAQIVRWVKKFHTLPNYKVRFKPFFQKIKHQDQLLDVHVHDSRITRGQLFVNIIDCSRLVIPDTAVELYCTASVGETPSNPQIGLWQRAWPCKEISVCKSAPTEQLGMKYKSCSLHDEGKRNTVIVTQVILFSPSHHGGIRQGDIIQKIDNISISSVSQAEKLIKNARKLKLLITIRRPSIDILKILHDKTIDQNNKRSRSKSPKILSKSSHLFPEVTSIGDNEKDNISLLAGSDGEDDNSNEFEVTQDSNSNIPMKRSLMKERALSTPPTLETNSHRPLAISLEPPELTNSYQQGASPPSVNPSQVDNSDNVSMKLSHDYSIQSHDSHTTKSVSVSRNPTWNEEFNYLLTSNSRYLNVCVWCRLQGEHKNFMIGCISLSLTDISLECLASGIHKQRYVLLPGKEMKTSKIALKAMNELPQNAKISSTNAVPKYVGDICLSFVHEPMETPTDIAIESSLEHNVSLPDAEMAFTNHPFTAKEGTEPGKHEFQMYEVKHATKQCYVCRKKIRKKARKCSRCNILAHEKCVHYCMSVVLCKFISDGQSRIDPQEQDQAWVELDKDGEQILTYSISKQQMDTTSTTSIEEGVISEDPLSDKSIAEYNEEQHTPPMSDSDDDNEPAQKNCNLENCNLEEDSDGVSVHGFVDIITHSELEDKILDAQKTLVMLEDNKRALITSDPPLSKDTIEYKLQKYDAQIETTDIKLKEYKERMRKLYSEEC